MASDNPYDKYLPEAQGSENPYAKYLPGYVPPKTPESSDFTRGFKEAWQQVPQLGYGLMAGAGAAAETAFGEGGLSTGLKQAGIKGYQTWGDKIQAGAKESDDWNNAYDQAVNGEFGGLVDWLQHGLGYVTGQGVQMLATAGLGGLAGKFVARTAARQIADGMVAKEAARIGAAEGGAALTAAEINAAATRNVAEKFASIGQNTAIGGMAFGQEGGEIFGDLTSDNKDRALTGAELGKAFVATLAAGGLEFVGDKIGLDVILGKSPLLKPAAHMPDVTGRIARGAIAAAAESPIEAATEYGQTLLEEFGKGKDPLSEESLKQAKSAAALGALGGFTMGGAGGMLHGAKPKPNPNPVTGVRDILAAPDLDSAVDASMHAIAAPVVKADWEVVDDSQRALPAPSGGMLGLPAPTGPGVLMVDQAGNVAPQPAVARTDALNRQFDATQQADAAARQQQSLGKQTPRGAEPGQTPLPVGEASEVPFIPSGDATELGRIPTGEASDLLPTGDATELPRRMATGSATELPVETVHASDLLTGDGVPYGRKAAANIRARKEGFGHDNVVEIPGAGWVVRPKVKAHDGSDLPGAAGDVAAVGAGGGTQSAGSSGSVDAGGAVAPGGVGHAATAPARRGEQAQPVAKPGLGDAAVAQLQSLAERFDARGQGPDKTFASVLRGYAADVQAGRIQTSDVAPQIQAYSELLAKPAPTTAAEASEPSARADVASAPTTPVTPKVFKLRSTAERERDALGNTHRIRKVKGGFILRHATEKELAAAHKAGQRLASGGGVDVDRDSLLSAIAKLGGIRIGERADTVGEGNKNVGGKMLFNLRGKSIDDLANHDLREFGYIPAEHRSDPTGWLRSAVREEFNGTALHHSDQGTEWMEARVGKSGLDMTPAKYEAARAAEDQARQAEAQGQGPEDVSLVDLTPDDLTELGYTSISPEEQQATEELLAAAEALGLDTEALREDAARMTVEDTADAYHQEVRRLTREAIAATGRDAQGVDARAASQGGEGGSRLAGSQGKEQGGQQSLTLEAQDAKSLREKAAREAASAAADAAEQKRLADKAKADSQRDEFTLTGSDRPADVAAAAGQRDMFDAPKPTAPAPSKSARPEAVIELRKRIAVLNALRACLG